MTRRQDRGHREIEVGVFPNDGRGLAAELERHARQVRGRPRHDLLTRIAMAGERDERGQRVIDEGPPRVASASNEIHDARRQIDVLAEQPHELVVASGDRSA
jgi:hypothetical protein